MTTRTLHPWRLAFSIAALSGCSGQMLDVGSNPDGSGGGGEGQQVANTSGSGGGVASSPDQCAPAPALVFGFSGDRGCRPGSSPQQGTWRGYVDRTSQSLQNYPSDGELTLTLQGDDDHMCVSVVFGTPKDLEPATDPEASYPAGYDLSGWIPLIDGFTYKFRSSDIVLSAAGPSLQFHIPIAEPMESWCQLQRPFYDPPTEKWHCALSGAPAAEPGYCRQTDPCTGEVSDLSCAQFKICRMNLLHPCVCNEATCVGNTQALTAAFDLVFDGDAATGSVDNRDHVFLERVE